MIGTRLSYSLERRQLSGVAPPPSLRLGARSFVAACAGFVIGSFVAGYSAGLGVAVTYAIWIAFQVVEFRLSGSKTQVPDTLRRRTADTIANVFFALFSACFFGLYTFNSATDGVFKLLNNLETMVPFFVALATLIAGHATSLAFCRDRLASALFVVLYLPFPVILMAVPLLSRDRELFDFWYIVPFAASLLASLAFVPLALAALPAARLNRKFAFILVGLGFVPGMPMIPFVVLGVALFIASRRIAKLMESQPVAGAAGAPGAAPAPVAEPKSPLEGNIDEFLQADRISLEIGAALIPLVNAKRGPGLLDRIGGLRRDLAKQNGLWVPAVRVKDNLNLDSQAYRVLISGREVARGEVRPELWMAIDPSGAGTIVIDGEDAKEPAFGLPAKWILDADRQRAEMNGYTVVDAPSVVITHLGEVVRKHAQELLSREDLKALVDRVRETNPAVVDELVPNMLSMGSLHRVLLALLDERVPISNLPRIFESLASHAATTKDVRELTERVREDIGRAICDRFRDATGRLRAVVLDPRLEIEFRRSVQGNQLVLDPGRLEQLTLRMMNEIRKAGARGYEVALLCDSSLRRAVRHALSRALGDLSVIAFQEIPTDMLMEPVAVIRPEDLLGGTANFNNLLESAGRT